MVGRLRAIERQRYHICSVEPRGIECCHFSPRTDARSVVRVLWPGRSDIWAVRGMNSVKERIIKSITPKHQHLIELNNILIELMENEELVGISLKKVNFGDNAEIHLYNVDLSDKLKSLASYSKIERN